MSRFHSDRTDHDKAGPQRAAFQLIKFFWSSCLLSPQAQNSTQDAALNTVDPQERQDCWGCLKRPPCLIFSVSFQNSIKPPKARARRLFLTAVAVVLAGPARPKRNCEE